ncbi:related to protein involved in the assembly of the mitochondrial succinate dehydrogenase complex [Ustilago trichophora]|uniref:Related to protein involved in the assembly of the mitochondrial succinate dehydrogenase complex n=1 Tax=Ustilago trichophora TaxID=86804 RepID=A0A5C3EAT6_9BASI|nr:related to protein involved in the assembly of the mitochondrial succinate dehydrogenase complex [Ustilago trichophora]
MPPAKKLTQAQKEILALYRQGLRMIKTKEQEHRRDFTIYLRYFFKHPSWGGGLRRRDFAQIEYMQRKTARLLETTFEPKSVKHINLPKDIEKDMQELGLAHWRRVFRSASGSSASNASASSTIPSSSH